MVIPETFTTFLPTHFGKGQKIKTFHKIIEKSRELQPAPFFYLIPLYVKIFSKNPQRSRFQLTAVAIICHKVQVF